MSATGGAIVGMLQAAAKLDDADVESIFDEVSRIGLEQKKHNLNNQVNEAILDWVNNNFVAVNEKIEWA